MRDESLLDLFLNGIWREGDLPPTSPSARAANAVANYVFCRQRARDCVEHVASVRGQDLPPKRKREDDLLDLQRIIAAAYSRKERCNTEKARKAFRECPAAIEQA